MNASIQRFFLLTIGLLFCVLGCTRDRGHTLIPDHISHPTEVMTSTADIEVSFEQDLLPILTARCALAGCHVADGPHGLDFRTYESFIVGGEHGPAFIPGNAEESEVVEEITEGKMPPPDSGLPKVPDAEIQVFVDWINQQEAQEGVIQQEHGDAHEDAHEEMEVEHEEDDEHDEDIDDGHDDMDDVHDEEEDEHGEDDEHDDEDDDDNGHDDN